MKKFLSIIGVVCFVLGFAMATGVDANPVQAIYALLCMGAACVCFKGADAVSSRTSDKQEVKSDKLAAAHYQDAA